MNPALGTAVGGVIGCALVPFVVRWLNRSRRVWVACPDCGGCGGRFDAYFVDGGCSRCEGRGAFHLRPGAPVPAAPRRTIGGGR